jgi:hypothetical protein
MDIPKYIYFQMVDIEIRIAILKFGAISLYVLSACYK